MHQPALLGDTLIEKLQLNVQVDGACLRWTGAHSPTGYGYLKYPGGPTGNVHRMAYEVFVEPIPEGLEIDHLCRVRDCINVDHLEVVTHKENVRRARERSASHAL